MNIDKILTGKFKNKIKEAVRNAETQSGGEIVTYIAEQSDNYSNIYWAAGFFSTFLGSSIFIFLYRFFNVEISQGLLFLGAIFLLPLLIVSLLYLFKPLRSLLIEEYQKKYYVNLRAKEAFLNQEVFNTVDRTGVLIYISLFEKRVVVLGDTGINKKVSKDKWNNVIKTIVKGIKNDSLIDGIVSGVLLCGTILKENKVKRRVKDINELDDNIHIGGKK